MAVPFRGGEPAATPAPIFDHLLRLSDDTGLLEHARARYRAGNAATASTTSRGDWWCSAGNPTRRSSYAG
jgi:hypothetical protein